MRAGLPRIQRWLEPRGAPSPARSPTTPPPCCSTAGGSTASSDAARPLVRAGCLTRGVTGYYGLRRAGLDISLCFGVGVVGGSMEGHCWLELADRAVLEPDDPRTVFAEVARVSRAGVTDGATGPRTDGRVGSTYAVAGLTIEAVCEDPTVAGMVEGRLAALRADLSEPADITIEITKPGSTVSRPAVPAGPGRPMYNGPDQTIDYFEQDDQLFADFADHVVLSCHPVGGRIRIDVVSTDPADRVVAAHPLLTVALHETVKRFGRFPLHAAGLALGGQGVLVPGTSGAGKSTLTVTLVRAGFDFLSDDTVFLTRTTRGIVVSGFPDEIDVTEATVAMFPELRHLASRPLALGRDKHGFRVDDVFGVAPLTACRPAVLLFPRVEEGPSPHLESLSPSEALVELMPNVLVTEPDATQAHMDMLGELVRTVPGYRFRPGPDVDAAAACITSLVS